ncbi:hypothetical protein GCM10023212_06690 [Luteolibacter yonseiensis]
MPSPNEVLRQLFQLFLTGLTLEATSFHIVVFEIIHFKRLAAGTV